MIRFSWSLCALGLAVACGGSSIRRGGDSDGEGGDNGNQGGTGGRGGTGSAEGGTGATAGTVAGTGGSTVSRGGTGTTGKGGVSGVAGVAGTMDGGGPVDPPGPVSCGGFLCEAPMACCLTTSRCFNPETNPGFCPQPDPEDDGRTPCASSAHCGPGEYCRRELEVLCQGTGYCQSRSSCPFSGYSVCACDGNSYSDMGAACRAGANVGLMARAACGNAVDLNDGAIEPPRWVTTCASNAHCASDELCCPLTSLCYPASDPGRCQIPPAGYPCTADDQCGPEDEFCAGDGCSGPGGCVRRENEECGVRLEPVCGCNGVSYTSAACAQSEGTRVRSVGECGEGGAASE